MSTKKTKFASFSALLLLFLSISPIPNAFCLPTGFRDEGVNFKSGTTGFSFVPKENGAHMLLICQRKGEVIAMLEPDTPDSQTVTVLDIEHKVCRDGERGISQIQPHPNFLRNRYIYLFYTYDKHGNCEFSTTNGPVNVVSRFRLTEDLKMVDEKILLQTSPLPAKVHNAGDMVFGNDGFLYVSIGDGGEANVYSNAQKLNTLLGSIVRITDSGGIPPDNPFRGDSDSACSGEGATSSSRRCSEIFAYGFRNPFRFAMNPNEKGFTQLFVSDVGGATWEEISEVTSQKPGLNYGYRYREGPCKRGSKSDCKPDDKYEDPLYWYEHNSDGDGAVTGGAFVPNDIGWPQAYRNKFMFADFVFKKIYLLERDGDWCRNCNPPRPEYERNEFRSLDSIGQPVQLTFGPYKNTQALYYSVWDPDGRYTIRRVIYEGGDDSSNNAPDASIKIEDRNYRVGEDIVFDGSESSDPDNHRLVYRWDFGDGDTSTLRVKTKSYSRPGTYVVSLTITDELGFGDKKYATVVVGNPPTPVIHSPRPGTTFAVGEVFTLVGSAKDDDGNPLSDSDLTWEVRQHHNTHYHPFLEPTKGNQITIPGAPSPEDFEASTNSYLEVLLTATDKDGVTSTVTVDIMPKTKSIYFSTDPPGLEVILDGFDIETPKDRPLEVITWINHNLVIDVKDQKGYGFDGLSNGVQSRHSEIKIGDESDMFVIKFSSPTSQERCSTIYDILCSTDELSEFCAVIEAAGLRNAFQSGAWTVFAPTNQAFSEFPTDLMQSEYVVFSSGESRLEDVILFHTSDTAVLFKNDLPCVAGRNLVPSAIGKDSRTLCDRHVPRFQKGKGNADNALPEIVNFDIQACNGVIHTINKILLFDNLVPIL
ncbi:PKD domain containing protein [Nitzschia inconspicua]|uniref:PKD domain containing protein n=1 Tax=Nitzschia inconspicua TaxID=303405 RepID=A0A9K3LM29_9STRA|nr:PKD domain containing protein [Nitzschia inconspicua]